MKRELILGVDVGTSSVKIGIFDKDLNVLKENKHGHNYETFGKCVQIDPEILFNSFLSALEPLKEYLDDVVAFGFSVLCPNLICMDEEAKPSGRNIHLDRRSQAQGLEIAEKVGVENFRNVGGNIPCPGGVDRDQHALVKENEPEIYKKPQIRPHQHLLYQKAYGELGGRPHQRVFHGPLQHL